MTDKAFQRKTRQREVIMEELAASKSHPTAAELYQTVRRRVPNISLGTVYRNLDLLSQAGTIQKLDTIGSEARFDGNPAPRRSFPLPPLRSGGGCCPHAGQSARRPHPGLRLSLVRLSFRVRWLLSPLLGTDTPQPCAREYGKC